MPTSGSTPELAAEIRRWSRRSPAAWHLIPVDNYIGDAAGALGLGRVIRPVGPCRRCSARAPSDGAISGCIRRSRLSGPQGTTLSSRLVHYVDRDISEMLRRLDRYTTARAQDLRDSGDIGSYGRNLRRIVSRFWKCYVGRKGYREGPRVF